MREASHDKTTSGFALGLDVDGVLTDDRVYVDKDGDTKYKTYCTEDFQIIKRLIDSGIKVLIITQEQPQITLARFSKIIDDIVYINPRSKHVFLRNYIPSNGITNLHYIGDSIFTDLPLAEIPEVNLFTPKASSIHKLKISTTCKNELIYNRLRRTIVLRESAGRGVVVDWFINNFIKIEADIWKKMISGLD